MTVAAIVARGPQFRRNTAGDIARISYLDNQTLIRFASLPAIVERRRIDIRAAHRRWLRKAGLPLTPTANKTR